MTTKTCRLCGEAKEETEFYMAKNKLRSECKVCFRARRREKYGDKLWVVVSRAKRAEKKAG